MDGINPNYENKINNIASKRTIDPQSPFYFKIFSDYVSNNLSGSSNFFKMIEKGIQWPLYFNDRNVIHLNSSAVAILANIQERYIGSGLKILFLLKIPNTFSDLLKHFQEFINEFIYTGTENFARTRDVFLKTFFDLISDISSLILLGEVFSLFAFGYIKIVIKTLISICGLLNRGFDFKIAGEDFFKYKDLHKYLNNPASNTQEALQNSETELIAAKEKNRKITILKEMRNLDLIKLAQDIVCIALSALIITELVFSLTMPIPVMYLIASAGIILHVWVNFYEKSMTYPEDPVRIALSGLDQQQINNLMPRTA